MLEALCILGPLGVLQARSNTLASSKYFELMAVFVSVDSGLVSLLRRPAAAGSQSPVQQIVMRSIYWKLRYSHHRLSYSEVI
jgi:hypothetical protein